jgi:octaprenyl-diphosphate synthase
MGGERSDDDFHRALALLKRHNAIGLTLDAARAHAAHAREALAALPANAYREALADLPDFVVERAY